MLVGAGLVGILVEDHDAVGEELLLTGPHRVLAAAKECGRQ